MANNSASLTDLITLLEDPRAEHLTDHGLIDIITIAICAVICGAESWTDIELLRLLDVSSCLVTIDAMGCQTEIAEQIIDQEADYLLTVMENQGHLYEYIDFFFQLAHQNEFQKVDYTYERPVNKGQGRIETRQCWAISGEDSLQYLHDHDQWKGQQTIAQVQS